MSAPIRASEHAMEWVGLHGCPKEAPVGGFRFGARRGEIRHVDCPCGARSFDRKTPLISCDDCGYEHETRLSLWT